MLVQIKNRLIRLESVSYASIEFPDENTTHGWIELLSVVDGDDLILMGDEALVLWQALVKNAITLPCEASPVSFRQVGTRAMFSKGG